ncbi:serine hydrolase domain-containing protein [Peptidiphaga sp.]|uniref:serine hydrolase domain-containing protein n=1 Tax=Peptidiphaga sp. TaxID=2848648 RepID=UPI003607F93D
MADADSVIASCGDLDAVFPMASVTKAVAALAALIAVERRLISLEDPAGPPGSTVRHLLAHASGLPFEGGAAISPPGRRRVYSNRGFEVLGEHIEAATGVGIQEWMEETVLIPLGMSAAAIPGSPADSGEGSVRDLLALGGELLAPTLISADIHAEATSPQFPGISGILPGYGRQRDNAWGLGVEIRDHKNPHWTGVSFSPRAFGHFGQAGSFLWVDPDAGRTGAFLGAKPFGTEHAEAWPALTDAMRAM